ncbi:MAG: hypothetical protein NTW78_05040 [Campylobacterales bacterium]|nr:hypothetical protein [Campylobacterales bacterium]
MQLKKYTIASFIFIGIIGWYIYAYVSQSSIAIDLFGLPLPSLSVAIWAIVPLVIYYIATLVHISFYSLLGSFKLRKDEKDYEKLIDSIVDAYLGKVNRNYDFKTPKYKLLGTLIENSTLFPAKNMSFDIDNEKIKTVLKLIEDIKNGEVVELKKYSLPSTNALVIQNEKNRYKKGDISAEEILSRADKFDSSLCAEAYVDLCKTASLSIIEKYKLFLTKDALFEILARINADENVLTISNEALINLLSAMELLEADYVRIATILSVGMVPEQRINLFSTLSDSHEEAMSAYLFTLFDLEMLEPADEILQNSQPLEYLNFKSYRALKECNKNFNINLFV